MWVTFLLLLLLSSSVPSSSFSFYSAMFNRSAGGRTRGMLLPGMELAPDLNFDPLASSSCGGDGVGLRDERRGLKLELRRGKKPERDVRVLAGQDLWRIQTFERRKNPEAASGRRYLGEETPSPARIMATLESGVSQGSGEYFMDVYIGTPPRHFSLILDTGSDLNWIQCSPCHDCFEQSGAYYDPSLSSSYRNVSCADPRCRLVSSPDPQLPCRSADQPCPYYYWYGDRSNTTGDLALETFTVNLTASGEPLRIDGILFGCGHWNRGLFHGAAGLLGMGRGPLSFPSQLRKLYGHSFSYCLVDRNSDASVTSKLFFGQDRGVELNYTSLVVSGDNPSDVTFYYLNLRGVMVGGVMLDVPPSIWEISPHGGGGGTIIDSGTTLSYFVSPAYEKIKEAFREQVGQRFPVVDFPVLELCYNVSGAGKGRTGLPEFAMVFADGAVWRFPEENSFIRLEPEEVMCLAMLGIAPSSFNILGNYQQQNFHITYDVTASRLGFAAVDCAVL